MRPVTFAGFNHITVYCAVLQQRWAKIRDPSTKVWAVGAVEALDLLFPQTCHPMLSVLACLLPAKDQFKFPVL